MPKKDDATPEQISLEPTREESVPPSTVQTMPHIGSDPSTPKKKSKKQIKESKKAKAAPLTATPYGNSIKAILKLINAQSSTTHSVALSAAQALANLSAEDRVAFKRMLD
jgi:hypothetical protein